MDPRFTSVRAVGEEVELLCEECKTIIHTCSLEDQPASLFALVRTSLRHSCASVSAIVGAALEDQVKQEVEEENDAMEAD